jgi:hypothetical protein
MMSESSGVRRNFAYCAERRAELWSLAGPTARHAFRPNDTAYVVAPGTFDKPLRILGSLALPS